MIINAKLSIVLRIAFLVNIIELVCFVTMTTVLYNSFTISVDKRWGDKIKNHVHLEYELISQKVHALCISIQMTHHEE